eukprot:CAMPEP_0119125302 /NCGR_PEP_ID=MMETSP1310-20130426/4625_1 /TAXON_ID=464262 /ORGANISM="Genus nov. species nov., Strain RCC2339" /LENGTH=429 /DNA_ID=CAMNT_0007115353 /DNA_START=184 /DNA_END=1473 /DNA_ORIENTATION=+
MVMTLYVCASEGGEEGVQGGTNDGKKEEAPLDLSDEHMARVVSDAINKALGACVCAVESGEERMQVGSTFGETESARGLPEERMARAVSDAVNKALYLSDAYLALGAAYDGSGVDGERWDVRRVFDKALTAHDYAGTLGNWLNTMGARTQYTADWEWHVETRFPNLRALEQQEARLDEERAALTADLKAEATALRQWATLSYVELADNSTLHDPAPERPEPAHRLADLRDWTADPAQRGRMGSKVAAAARQMVQNTLQSSRVYFAFANALDRTESSEKGYTQWFEWRARSDLVNAVTMIHYLASRSVAYEAGTYDVAPVRLVAPAEPDPQLLMRSCLILESSKAALLNQWYDAAEVTAEEGSVRFLRTSSVVWYRTGDAEDEPEWAESLLVSAARKVEDVRKILRIAERSRGPGLGLAWFDHQLPDTIP